MRVIGVQMDIAWEDHAANRAKVERLLESAKIHGGELVVLPEMFASGFTMNVAAAEDREGATWRFLQAMAKKWNVAIVAGVVSRSAGGRGRNEAVVIAPGSEEVARYCKLHPFSIGGESEHYEAGCEIVTFAWGGFTVAPFVCYDLRFPEIFRSAAIGKGANLLIVIANWPSKREEHWTTLLRARAIENQAYVVGVNRCGRDPKHEYPGRSMVIDPHGIALVDAGRSECIIEAEIDAAVARDWRETFPVLRDARSPGGERA